MKSSLSRSVLIAGVEGKDIDILLHGQIGNVSFSRLLEPATLL